MIQLSKHKIAGLFFCIITGTLFAEEFPPIKTFPYTVSLSQSAGFLYGAGEERVYKTDGAVLSKLTWEMKPLFYYGAGLDFSRRNKHEKPGFSTALSLKAGIPSMSGFMEDQDWNTPSGELSNYSAHYNYTEGALILDYKAGLSIPLYSRFLLELYLGFSWMHFNWNARDGYIRYPKDQYGNYLSDTPLGPDEKKDIWSGPAVAYSQEWLLAFPGVGLSLRINRFFSAAFSFQMSPLIFCRAKDNHFATGTEYSDSMDFGMYTEPRAEISFIPRERLSLSLYCSWRNLEADPGSSRSRKTGINTGSAAIELENESGAAWKAFDSGIRVSLRF
ncbi:MAG: omptin family outer membrane protease [Treponema sp.]|nr:omptin family outer membrane protease [Treponema sp.]